MAILTVWIPAPMRLYSHDREVVAASGSNVKSLIQDLDVSCPGIKDALLDEAALKADVAVVVDGHIAPLGLWQSLEGAKEVTFIPAISGG